MPFYHITWDMDIEADTPVEAAEKAVKIDKSEHAFIVFDPVTGDPEYVDLAAIHEEQREAEIPAE